MVWLFSLSAECGSNKRDVNTFAQYFDGIEWQLSNSHLCQCRTDTFQDLEQNWWCRVYPHNTALCAVTEYSIIRDQSLRMERSGMKQSQNHPILAIASLRSQ